MIVFFSWIGISDASIIFNEVQLNPTEGRFIELYNDGDSSINLTGWYIQRKTESGSSFGSLVSKTYLEGVEIQAKDYLVISRTLINNSDIIVSNLTLTESNSIQIKNSGQEIVNSIEWGTISEGESTQRTSNGQWKTASPTPGEENNEDSSLVESNNSSSDSLSNSEQEEPIERKVIVKIITPKIVFAGMPFKINSLITTNRKETLAVGKFIWNFGDGSAKEDKSSSEFEHIYYYPGEYVISLDYSQRTSFSSDSSDRIIIKVVPSEILISSVGNRGDAFIEIENKSSYEVALSGWIIQAGGYHFKIPQGTILLAKKKLKISSRVTGFVAENLKFVTLLDSKGELITTYPQKKIVYSKNKVNIPPKETPELVPSTIDLNELGASAGRVKGDYSWANYSYWALGGIILIGIISVIFLRKKDDSLDYMEQEIRAEDMTIIE